MIAEKIAPAANGGRWKKQTPIVSPAPRPAAMPRCPAWRTTYAAPPFIRSDRHYELATQIAELRGKLELELVALAGCDPIHGSRLLRDCGVTTDLYAAEDVRIIALAIDLAGERGIEKTAKVARLALRYFGYWDESDTRTFTRGPLWSDFSLSGLMNSRFYSPTMIRIYAEKLRKIAQRERIAAACERRALAALEGGMDAFAMLLLKKGVNRE